MQFLSRQEDILKRRALLVALCFLGALGCQRAKPLTLSVQATTALHEAAHAVVGFATNPSFPLTRIEVSTVVAEGQNTVGFNGRLKTEGPKTAESRLHEAAMLFAGDEAEETLLGIPNVAYTDDQQEAKLACMPPCQPEHDDKCSLMPSAERIQSIYNQTDECFECARQLTKQLVLDHGVTILGLADLLMKQAPSGPSRTRRLDATTVREFLRNSGLKITP
jgi:hypothetical protein